MFYLNIRIYHQLGICGLKTSFVTIGPKYLPSHKSRTLAPIFINRTLFYRNLSGEICELQKCQNQPPLRSLGCKTQFWAKWAQKTQQPVSPEPESQFSQTSLHFMWNVKLNKMYYLDIRVYLQLRVWGIKTSLGLIWPKRLTTP